MDVRHVEARAKTPAEDRKVHALHTSTWRAVDGGLSRQTQGVRRLPGNHAKQKDSFPSRDGKRLEWGAGEA